MWEDYVREIDIDYYFCFILMFYFKYFEEIMRKGYFMQYSMFLYRYNIPDWKEHFKTVCLPILLEPLTFRYTYRGEVVMLFKNRWLFKNYWKLLIKVLMIVYIYIIQKNFKMLITVHIYVKVSFEKSVSFAQSL